MANEPKSRSFFNVEAIKKHRIKHLQAEKDAYLERLSQSFKELKYYILLPISTIESNDQTRNIIFWANALISENDEYEQFIKDLSPAETERLRLYLFLDNKIV